MSDLAWISLGWAVVLAVLAIGALMEPDVAGRLQRFSRNRGAAWVLTAVTLGWGTWLLWRTPLGQFDALKPLVAVLAPVGYVLIVLCMRDLLAARALGVLFILAPAPMLTAVRWHPSQWRLVVVALCYVMATTGIALVLSPYLLRKWGEKLSACPVCRRAVPIAGLLLAVALVLVAMAVR